MKKKSGTSTVREVIWTIKISGESCEIKDYPFFCRLIASSAIAEANSLTQAIEQTYNTDVCVRECVMWPCFKNAYSSTAVSNPHLL